MAHAKWAALTFRSKLMEPNFSKFVLLNCTFFIPLTLEKALGLLLGLIAWAWFQNVTACLFHGMSCSLSWLGPFQHCLLRGHCFIGLGYNATTCLGHKRAVVKTKCFVTQI